MNNVPNVAPVTSAPVTSIPAGKPNTTKIIAIVVGVLVAIAGIYLAFRVIFSRASGEEAQNVQIVDINENSAKITWTSPIETQCTVEYGTTPTSLGFFAPENAATASHSVSLTLLSPNSTYYFQIRCGDKTFTNGGVPYSFTTQVTSANQGRPVATPTQAVNRPTPIQSIEITPSSGSQSCPETSDCNLIKDKLGQGCSTQDYFKCKNKTVTPTP